MAPKHTVDESGFQMMLDAWANLPDEVLKDHACVGIIDTPCLIAMGV